MQNTTPFQIYNASAGSGKTFTALTALKEHLEPEGVALVLVPDKLLHRQWASEIKEEIEGVVVRTGAQIDEQQIGVEAEERLHQSTLLRRPRMGRAKDGASRSRSRHAAN